MKIQKQAFTFLTALAVANLGAPAHAATVHARSRADRRRRIMALVCSAEARPRTRVLLPTFPFARAWASGRIRRMAATPSANAHRLARALRRPTTLLVEAAARRITNAQRRLRPADVTRKGVGDFVKGLYKPGLAGHETIER